MVLKGKRFVVALWISDFDMAVEVWRSEYCHGLTNGLDGGEYLVQSFLLRFGDDGEQK